MARLRARAMHFAHPLWPGISLTQISVIDMLISYLIILWNFLNITYEFKIYINNVIIVKPQFEVIVDLIKTI